MLGSLCIKFHYYDAYYMKALKTKAFIKQAFDWAFEMYDVILTCSASLWHLSL